MMKTDDRKTLKTGTAAEASPEQKHGEAEVSPWSSIGEMPDSVRQKLKEETLQELKGIKSGT